MDRKIEDLYAGEDFYAQGELAGGFLFLHCELFRHDKSTIKKLKKAIEETIAQARQLGYDKPVFSYVEKGARSKLSRIVGGDLCNTFVEDGKVFEVYKWD